MSSYHGLCAIPHGGRATSMLWVSMACATICTCYSIASCRLVTLTYESALGNFEGHFTNRDAAIEVVEYQVGLGLFTWLLPSFYVDGDDDTLTRATIGNWQEGTCVGYNTLQLEELMDTLWDAVRMLGIFAVLIALSMFCFGLSLTCLSIVQWQRTIMALSALVVAIINGCTLLMLQSGVCTHMGTPSEDDNDNLLDANTTSTTTSTTTTTLPTSHCELDQGGLVAIGAVILWISTAIVTYFFIESPGDQSTQTKAQARGDIPEQPKPRQSKKEQSAWKQMRKENKIDWNNSNSKTKSRSRSASKISTKTKSQAKRSSTRPRSLSQTQTRNSSNSISNSKANTTPRTVHASFSMPSPKYIVDDLKAAEQQRAIPVKQAKHGANNKSLEATYFPPPSKQYNDNNNDNQNDNQYNDDYDCIPYQKSNDIEMGHRSNHTVNSKASRSIPPPPSQQANRRQRPVSQSPPLTKRTMKPAPLTKPKMKPVPPPATTRSNMTTNNNTRTHNNTNNSNNNDYVQEVHIHGEHIDDGSVSRLTTSTYGGTRARNARQQQLTQVLQDDLELQLQQRKTWLPCDTCF